MVTLLASQQDKDSIELIMNIYLNRYKQPSAQIYET